MSDEATEFLTGDGCPAAKFAEPGAKVVGVVLRNELVQQRDFGTKTPLVWDDGSPRMQAVITLQADDYEPVDDDDDGRRKLYVKSPKMRAAIGEAIRKSGHKGSIVGGRLGVMFTRYGEGKNAQNPPKLYSAKFEPPAAEPDQAGEDGYAEGEEPF